MTLTDTELESLLVRGAPAPDPEAGALSATLAREIIHTDRERAAGALRRRRNRRAAIGVALAALVIAPPAAYATHRYLVQTGTFGQAELSEEDGSEWVDVCKPDLAAYLRSLPKPAMDPPPGMTWTAISDQTASRVQWQARENCAGSGERQQSTGLRSQVLWTAQDWWLDEAHTAHEAGRTKQAWEAANRFADLMDAQDRLGVNGDEQWKPYRDAARAGDFAKLDEFWLANSSYAPGGPNEGVDR
ncbi:MAG: hypothetical protein LWW86_15345 [Micrococcales bacterium]|nr:hypothetical protein [Micrococcales bacterium]